MLNVISCVELSHGNSANSGNHCLSRYLTPVLQAPTFGVMSVNFSAKKTLFARGICAYYSLR